jgi:DNA-binding beta-propeller fold protein YncE
MISVGLAAGSARAQTVAPQFEVDRSWPRPLPNGWVWGEVAGIAVDGSDHVWVLHRSRTVGGRGRRGAPPPPAPAGPAAPNVLELDEAGVVVRSWGGSDVGACTWPGNEHGLSVDFGGNVWVTGGGARDAHVLKLTPAGECLLQIGTPGTPGTNRDTTTLDRPTNAVVDPERNEVYITDGEVGGSHRRVMVFGADTGRFERMWGAYGNIPADGPAPANDPNGPPAQQFGTATHCVRIARDGLVYVCDRSNNRIQVFRKDGTFVEERFVARETGGLGAIWDLELSPDERFVYVADGQNQKIWILLRETLEIIGSFGGDGHEPGQIRGVNAIAVDSRGNIYIAEANDGRRIQKFLLR